MPLTFNAIFLGNSTTLIDPFEGDTDAERANLLVGQTFGTTSRWLAGQWVSFTSVNIGGNATALDQNNNVVNDQATITRDGVSTTFTFDGTAIYNVRITYGDGSQSALVPLVVVQMTNGDLYAVPSPTAGTATNAALSAEPIRSIQLVSLSGNNFAGMGIDRPVISFVTCFTRGTLLASPTGPRAVESVRRGQWLSTLDNGPRKVRWVGARRVTRAEMEANPKLQPVRIAKGALGCGLPERDLLVSRQHRVMVASAIVGRMAGCDEVLVAAHHLVGLPGIDQVIPDDGVEYWHVLFEGHEILISEGAPTESLWPGQQTMEALGERAMQEIRYAMPHLVDGEEPAMAPARPFIEGKAARKMAERHGRNGKTLLAKAPRPATWTAKDRPARHVA